MEKRFIVAGVLVALAIAAIILVTVYTGNSYTTTNSANAKCEIVGGSTEEAATEIINSKQKCHISGKGAFSDESFVHLKCQPEENESFQQFVFASMSACIEFKELSNVEYIKVILTNMLPPNK